MSALLMGRAFYFELAPLPKLLLLAVADHANDDGYGAHPSQRRLASKLGCTERHVRRLLGLLDSMGLIEVIKRGDGRGYATDYFLPWAADKADISTIKADIAIAAQPSTQPSDLPSKDRSTYDRSTNDRSTNDPSKANTLKELEQRFLSAEPSQRVARLVDIGDALGFRRNGGFAAAIVRDFGHGIEVVRACRAALEANGDPWEYIRKVLKGEEARHGRLRGGQERVQGAVNPPGTRGAGEPILTLEEAEELGKARGIQAVRGGRGTSA